MSITTIYVGEPVVRTKEASTDKTVEASKVAPKKTTRRTKTTK